MTDFLQFSFDKFDEDGNDELSFMEFEKIFANFIATSGSTMIKVFDKNGNGLLDKAEIVQVRLDWIGLDFIQGRIKYNC